MEEHGGQITVDSHPGRGSRFTLELPGGQPSAERKPAPAVRPTITDPSSSALSDSSAN